MCFERFNKTNNVKYSINRLKLSGILEESNNSKGMQCLLFLYIVKVQAKRIYEGEKTPHQLDEQIKYLTTDETHLIVNYQKHAFNNHLKELS